MEKNVLIIGCLLWDYIKLKPDVVNSYNRYFEKESLTGRAQLYYNASSEVMCKVLLQCDTEGH